MAKHEIEIPDGVIPAGWEPVEFRPARLAEEFLSADSCIVTASDDFGRMYPRLILRRVKKMRPLTVAEACEAMIAGTTFGDNKISQVALNGTACMYSVGWMTLDRACEYHQVGVFE